MGHIESDTTSAALVNQKHKWPIMNPGRKGVHLSALIRHHRHEYAVVFEKVYQVRYGPKPQLPAPPDFDGISFNVLKVRDTPPYRAHLLRRIFNMVPAEMKEIIKQGALREGLAAHRLAGGT